MAETLDVARWIGSAPADQLGFTSAAGQGRLRHGAEPTRTQRLETFLRNRAQHPGANDLDLPSDPAFRWPTHFGARSRAATDRWIFTRGRGIRHLPLLDMWNAMAGDLRLPLVRAVGDRFAQQGLDLSNCILIAVQHLFASTVSVFEELARLNLPFHQMFVAGKVYSSHPAVEWRLAQLGAHVFVTDPLEVLRAERLQEDELRSSLATVIDEAVSLFKTWGASRQQRGRILILDDGALAISEAWRRHRSMCNTFACVEQTRRGAKTIRGHQLTNAPFAIVNVAESDSKLRLESPMIGESVVRCLDDSFRERPELVAPRDKGVLVVGYGTVGRAVAAAYRKRGIRVLVWDNEPRARRRVGADFCELRDGLGLVALAVGCTGVTWLTPEMVGNADLALASASTADVEFSSIMKLGTERCLLPCEIEEQGEAGTLAVHSDYSLNSTPGHVVVFNGGQPCNFDGSVDPIPANAIQLTRALLLAGVCSAALAKEGGLIPLPEEIDEFIGAEFEQLPTAW